MAKNPAELAGDDDFEKSNSIQSTKLAESSRFAGPIPFVNRESVQFCQDWSLMNSYCARLNSRIRACGTPALVGIDPRWDLLPKSIRKSAQTVPGGFRDQAAWAFERFSVELIEVIAPLVPAIKPQVAFFEQMGVPGCAALRSVMLTARKAGLLVIADAKRGDIGSTAEAYADAWLAGEDPDAAAWPADALTVNPYLGPDTLEPFVKCAVSRNAGIYVLVRTSNPGAADYQDRQTDGLSLYSAVAETVEELSSQYRGSDVFGPVGAVVGATWPAQLVALRAQMPHVPLLIPGYGTQGGTSADTAGAFCSDGLGALVNSSRGINFAWTRQPYSEKFAPERWQDAVAAATRDMIADLAMSTTAGKLKSSWQ